MDRTFSIEIEAALARLNGTAARVAGALEKRLDAITAALQAKIVGEKLSGNPIKPHTGKLAGSVRQVPVTNDGSRITGAVQAGGADYGKFGPPFYAKFLEYGTEPHLIVPVNKQVLAFIADGKNVFAKLVHHPGTPAYHFMSGTLQESKDEILASLKEAVREALQP